MSVPDPRSQRLSELSQCAYRLGLAFGAEAERAEAWSRRLEFFHLFDRCFFAVRVATALELRLGRPQAALRSEARAEREDLAERAEHDPRERDRDLEYERDRERETEPASLPVLLKTLSGVVADAARLPGPEPAALPSLRELLAEVTSKPSPAAAPRSPGGGLRARLAGSATAPILALSRPQPAPSLALRRATGPPRRGI